MTIFTAAKAEQYAAKFVNESTAYPTDGEIVSACAGCVVRPRPEWLPAIREAVLRLYGDRLAV